MLHQSSFQVLGTLHLVPCPAQPAQGCVQSLSVGTQATCMRLKSRMVMTAQPTVMSRRPIHALSGVPAMLSVACPSAAAVCLKGLPLKIGTQHVQHLTMEVAPASAAAASGKAAGQPHGDPAEAQLPQGLPS